MSEFKSPFKAYTLVLPLIEGDRSDVLNRVPLGCSLRFIIPPKLHGSIINLRTNHPSSPTAKFERTKFRKLDFTKSTWDDENYAEIQIVTNGSFQYQFDTNLGQSGSGYFSVNPVLRANDVDIDLNSLTVQTVLTKSLGPLKEWPERLKPTLEANYNAIHFTPIQELGGSNSSYSLMNQLKLNPSIKATFEQLGQYLDHLKEKEGVFSFADLVWNHTANETPWLRTNPEATYNLLNTPHLRPAYLLDAAMDRLSKEIGEDKWENYGVPKEINKEEHLEALRKIIHTHILPALKLEQFYMLDTEDTIQGFKARAVRLEPRPSPPEGLKEGLSIIQDPEYRRFSSMIDWSLALNLFHIQRGEPNDLQKSMDLLRSALIDLNESRENLIRSHLNVAVENILSGVRYERIDRSGPLYPVVDKRHPIIAKYFEKVAGSKCSDLTAEEEFAWSEEGRFIMAHNGWVMGDDPLRNFADNNSNVYLRRELIAWGDSVKLRYGQCPSDSPFLWNLMREYTEQAASMFHGIRLDNCHSTPIHVAEYMLDAARNVRPNIYIFAELFTNSDRVDNIFVNRLGITSLIREALTAWNPHEFGRLIFRYGGSPIGAFKKTGQDVVQSSIPHALFMDQTHDNPSPIEKRSLFDCLPTTALVAIAYCATGSNRGFDELVPHHIHVVNETRPYSTLVGAGISTAKSYLNKLHREIGSTHNQIFIDQHTPDIVAVTRHCESTMESIILIAYTSFSYPSEEYQNHHVRSMNVGVTEVTSVMYQARLVKKNGAPYSRPSGYTQSPTFINGLDGYGLISYENQPPSEAKFIKIRKENRDTILDFTDFHPGDIVIIKTAAQPSTVQSLKDLENLLREDNVTKLFRPLNLGDLNKILYRCEEEERDDTDGQGGAYGIPNFGPLVYCGLQGVSSVMANIRATNDLGHPLCGNLRDGDWLMDYLANRLVREDNTREVGIFLRTAFQFIKDFPRNLIPRFFDITIMIMTVAAYKRVWELMNSFIQNGSPLTKQLSLATVQVTGYSKSGYLPGEKNRNAVTLSAGLPHFSTGYMRNWGRDTFISLPGTYLVTGRIQDAKTTILAFASVLRHGLIPNLLDKGTHARYNCRDATWFWLYSIVRYCQFVPNGEAILKERVYRMYPNDLALPVLDNSVSESLEDTVYEAVSRHFQGISFRERNAGEAIDAHMKDEGFNVDIRVDYNTGFPKGGNRFNCGTWMDKMGSSTKAGNKGLPATPRDGAPVEIVALAYSVLKFLDNSYKAGLFRYDGVISTSTSTNGNNNENSENIPRNPGNNQKEIRWTWATWHETIKANFEAQFWIDEQDNHEYIHRRSIYKDTVGATLGYMDFQLRPNFVIAMAVADELFTTTRALKALENIREFLLGPLGLKTLDPADWNYNGDYDNSNDSSDMKVAHGFNYHNGPEWLWPIGFYLRSYVKFHSRVGEQAAALIHVKQVLSNHIEHINSSPWRGLPELTNKEGSHCSGSCTTQAWSMATVLETLYDLQSLSTN